jgi:hypothetical protein
MPNKTKSKAKSQKFWTRRNSIIVGLVVLFVGVSGMYVAGKVTDYDMAADQANMVSIRELILAAVRGAKKDAPVDPKTGDIYFPESRLYLPNPKQALPITYLEDTGDIASSHSSLTVSTYPVRTTEKLYVARNPTELFNAVPHLQSCSRGVKLSYEKFPSDDTTNELRSTITLDNGKQLYIYLDKGCPELKDLATTLKNVRPY